MLGGLRHTVALAALIAATPVLAQSGGAGRVAQGSTVAPVVPASAAVLVAAVAPVAPAATPAAAVAALRLNTTGRAITLTVPLRANGPLGQVEITLGTDDSLSLSVDDLVNALSRIVKAADLDRLKAAATNGRVAAAAARTLGFRFRYDPESVELVVDIAPELLSTLGIDIIRGGTYYPVQPDRSAKFAAYLNYRIGELFQISGPRRGEADFVGDFELAGRIANTLAFDSFATVDPRNDHTFTRTSSRVFYDLPGPALRITGGDLFTESAGFQTDPQISGVNVSHLIDTFYPNAPVSGTASRNLVLNRDADVQILVNGIPVSQLHLNAGSYDLRNLPVAQGANNLQAIITDNTGERRVQNFGFFQSARLLNPGIDEYTLSAGVLAPLGDAGPRYSNDPAVSGFYRRGITNQLTLGADVQAAKIDQVLGVDATLGTLFGLFGANVAINRLQSGQVGGAARVQYSYASQTNSTYFARTIDLFVEYDSKYFLPLSGLIAFNPVINGGPGGIGGIPNIPFDLGAFNTNTQAVLVSGSVNQPLTRNLNFQLNGNYSHGRGGFGDRGALSALITYQAPFQTTLGLGVTYQWAPRDFTPNFISGRGFSFLATLTHRFGPQTVASATVDRFTQRATFTRTPTRPVDDFFITADASRTPFGTSANATAGYETNRGDILATYNTALTRGGSIIAQQTGVFFNGSLVVADTRVGLGRRITDSFAVIGKDSSLGGRQVLIQSRFANQTIARSGTFGPAVVPLSSYQRSLVPYDVADLPPGYDLGSGAFELYPWYRSGYSLKVGSPYNVTALGDLVDADGKPVVLRTGIAVSQTDPKAPKVDVITNRTGRFAASGLAPGRYRITISDDPSLVYDLIVVQNPEMLTRFGVLKPIAR